MDGSFRALALLDNDRQIHALVNRTIDVIGPCSGERSDLKGTAADLHVVDGGRARLSSVFWLTILPGAIGEDVEKRAIFHQHELRAFGNGDRRLEKAASAQMH